MGEGERERGRGKREVRQKQRVRDDSPRPSPPSSNYYYTPAPISPGIGNFFESSPRHREAAHSRQLCKQVADTPALLQPSVELALSVRLLLLLLYFKPTHTYSSRSIYSLSISFYLSLSHCLFLSLSLFLSISLSDRHLLIIFGKLALALI